jgi:hypothetical protein
LPLYALRKQLTLEEDFGKYDADSKPEVALPNRWRVHLVTAAQQVVGNPVTFQQAWDIPNDGSKFTFGRAGGSADGQVVTLGTQTSRVHCEVWVEAECRADPNEPTGVLKLKDFSTNGTFVCKAGSQGSPVKVTNVTVLQHDDWFACGFWAGQMRVEEIKTDEPLRHAKRPRDTSGR